MTRPELIQALNDLWRSYNAMNRRTMSGPKLTEPRGAEWSALQDTLAEWFKE